MAAHGFGSGSALYKPFDSSTTRLGVSTSGRGIGIAGKLPTTPYSNRAARSAPRIALHGYKSPSR